MVLRPTPEILAGVKSVWVTAGYLFSIDAYRDKVYSPVADACIVQVTVAVDEI